MIPISSPSALILRGSTYTTMGTVCASSLLWCLVDLDVLDDEVGCVEALGVGIRFGVLEETEEELSGLNWPAGTGDAHLLAWEFYMSVLPLLIYVYAHPPVLKVPSTIMIPNILKSE
jgi:hypothetical protein